MGGSRFDRSRRLLTAAEFRQVFAAPKRSTDHLFTVLTRGSREGNARLGLAISRKLVRRAVDRNRIKRLVRESFRQHQVQLKGLDVVVLARRETAGADNRQLLLSLQAHWQRLARASLTSGPETR
ncbi:MAG: ribonuclease P protein component [Pseudomonadota bacterium]